MSNNFLVYGEIISCSDSYGRFVWENIVQKNGIAMEKNTKQRCIGKEKRSGDRAHSSVRFSGWRRTGMPPCKGDQTFPRREATRHTVLPISRISRPCAQLPFSYYSGSLMSSTQIGARQLQSLTFQRCCFVLVGVDRSPPEALPHTYGKSNLPYEDCWTKESYRLLYELKRLTSHSRSLMVIRNYTWRVWVLTSYLLWV